MLKKLLAKLFTLKWVTTLVVIGVFFCVPVFAQSVDNDALDFLGVTLQSLISFLSRAWVFFAMMAGKLMTNEFVYGSFMHLDVFLRKIRNIMKNFASFTIGFMFVFYIVKYLFSIKEKPAEFFKTKVLALMVAGILIQASWFLIWAMLDISTIAVSAIWALPWQIIADSSTFQWTLTQEYKHIQEGVKEINWKKDNQIWDQIDIQTNPNDTTDQEDAENLNRYLDAILPTHDSLSGPLLFLWLSVFKFQEWGTLEAWQLQNLWDLVTTTGIKMLILVMFSIAMIFIFIINVVRIVMIRFLVIFSPFIILFTVLKKIGNVDVFEAIGRSKDWNLSSLMHMVFKPVIFTAYISIMLIFVIGMRTVLKPDNIQNTPIAIWDISVESDLRSSSIVVEWLGKTTIDGLQWGFSSLIVYLFVIFLMWQLIKLSVSWWPKFLSDIFSKLEKAIQATPKTIPFIPGPNGEMWSIQSWWDVAKKLKEDAGPVFNMWTVRKSQEDALSRSMWMWWKWMNEYDKKLTKAITNKDVDAFFSAASDMSGSLTDGLSIQGNSAWATHLENFLETMSKSNNSSRKNKPYTKKDGNTSSQNILQYFGDNQTIMNTFNGKMPWTPKTISNDQVLKHKYKKT